MASLHSVVRHVTIRLPDVIQRGTGRCGAGEPGYDDLPGDDLRSHRPL